jgi:hypothetical protein
MSWYFQTTKPGSRLIQPFGPSFILPMMTPATWLARFAGDRHTYVVPGTGTSLPDWPVWRAAEPATLIASVLRLAGAD